MRYIQNIKKLLKRELLIFFSFHGTLCLFSNSKCGRNKKVAHEVNSQTCQGFWHLLWAITITRNHGHMIVDDVICVSDLQLITRENHSNVRIISLYKLLLNMSCLKTLKNVDKSLSFCFLLQFLLFLILCPVL